MEKKLLTDEQQNKVNKIQRDLMKRSAIRGLKFGAMMFLSSMTISAINVFYVQNKDFFFLSTLVTFIFIFHYLKVEMFSDHDRVKEEIKKILES